VHTVFQLRRVRDLILPLWWGVIRGARAATVDSFLVSSLRDSFQIARSGTVGLPMLACASTSNCNSANPMLFPFVSTVVGQFRGVLGEV
jgi:hypothetical protein